MYSDTVVPWDVWEALKAEVNAGRLVFLPSEILKAYPSYVFVSQPDLDLLIAGFAAPRDRIQPAPNAAPYHANLTNSERPASVALIKKALASLIAYSERKQYPKFTRDEAQMLIWGAFPNNTREPIRKIVAAKVPASAKRRTRRQLNNRNNELEDCRQFLQTAS